MRRFLTSVLSLSLAASSLAQLPASPAHAAGAIGAAHGTLVSADPADWTPNIQDGIVNAVVQVGDEIVVGGDFLQAKNVGGPLLNVSSILAFDATTGTINQGFMPTFDGEILTLGTDGISVYVGGRFTKVNGVAGHRRLVKLDPATGEIIAAFKARIGSGEAVHDMAFANGKVYIGGAFSTIQGQTREKLAALDPVTGRLDPDVDVAFTGRHSGGTARIRKLDVTPDGTRLIAIGNFTLADGLDRDQVAMIDLTTDAVANWQTNRFKPACSSFFDTYTNDVDFSPDGGYFVIGTTGAFMGGLNAGVLCDTVTRWETGATGTGLQPTWVDYTGGDTTFSVTATSAAVYVGGHQRWWNNPYSSRGDSAGPGAVDRMGIAALDPVNGLPFSWDPVRDPRGLGVQMMLATPSGLWVGSDTSGIGGEFHGKIAFMPLEGGITIPQPTVARLPNDLWTLPQICGSQDPSILYRVNAGGSSVASGACQPDWAIDIGGSPSPLHTTGSNAISGGSVTLHPSIPAGTPSSIFSAAREDPAGGNEMQWNFNVPAGRQVKVRLYFANHSTSLRFPGQRVFNVAIDGSSVLSNFDIITAFGHQVGGMREFTVTSDGQVNVLFTHVVNNPIVSAIEIVDPNVTPETGGLDSLVHRAFDGTTPGPNVPLSTPGIDWSHARGAFVTDGKLFTGWDTGVFSWRPFDPTAVGAATPIDLHGITSTRWPVSTLTGMFFSEGRLYYTVSGDSRLFYRYFTPESRIVGTQTFVASGAGDGLNWGATSGLTLAKHALFVARTNGNLYRMNFANGVPTPGTETLLSGPGTGDGRDWRSRGMFVADQAVDTFAPTQPGTPSGTSTSTTATDLAWTASSDNISATLTYRVFRDGVQVGAASSASTGTVTFTDTGLEPGSTHTYTIYAVDEADNVSAPSAPSEPVVMPTPDQSPPTAPGTPVAAVTGTTRVDLTWAASTDDHAGPIAYRVFRDGVEVGQTTSAAPIVSYTDTGLEPATSVSYTVDATDLAGNTGSPSAASDPVTTGGVFFSDGFDTGDLSRWTSAARFSIDPTIGGSAAPSALASPAALSAMLVASLGADHETICASAAVNLTTANGTALDLLRLRTGANAGVAKVFLSVSGKLQVRSDVSGATKGSGVALPAGWNTIELCGTVGASGSWDLYLNGTAIVNAWVTDSGATGVGRVTLGDNTGKTFTVHFDDVVVDGFPG